MVKEFNELTMAGGVSAKILARGRKRKVSFSRKITNFL